MSKLIAVTVALVSIQRGLETITAQVYEHEIPLLEAVHGQDNVVVADPDYDTVEIPDDAAAELRRLQGKYDLKNAPAIVGHFFRSEQELAKAVGLSVQRRNAAAERPSEAGVYDHGREARRLARTERPRRGRAETPAKPTEPAGQPAAPAS